MKYICIGKIVNTHGIKGELRIISHFKFKSQVFKKGNKLYIGREKNKEIINTYRVHKNFDMVTFDNYNNINDVLKYKNNKVYINRDEFNFNEYLDEDLIGKSCYIKDENIGIIEKIEYVKDNKSLIVIKNNKNQKKYIPNNKSFIENVDVLNNKVYIKYIEGLIE